MPFWLFNQPLTKD